MLCIRVTRHEDGNATMDELDRACEQALRQRQAAYQAWRRRPSPETYAAYCTAFDAWKERVGPQAARQEIWQARRRGRPNNPLATLGRALRPLAKREALEPR